MTIEEQMQWSLKRSIKHWHHVADKCPFDGVAGSKLQSTEANKMWGSAGRTLDMVYGIDAFAVAESSWTPVALRVQDGVRHDYQTITIRVTGSGGGSSEWGRLRSVDGDDPIGARYHIQMYVHGDDLSHVVVVEVDPLRRHLRNYGPNGEGLRLLTNRSDGVTFVAFEVSELLGVGVRAWSSVGRDWPICSVCGGGMVLGQRRQHWICGDKCNRCFMYNCACSRRSVVTAESEIQHTQQNLLTT